MTHRSAPSAVSFTRSVVGWIGALLLASCTTTRPPAAAPPEPAPAAAPAPAAKPAHPAPVERRSWAQRTLDRLTLRQKVAQMIMPSVLGDFSPVGSYGYDRITRLVEKDQVGGILMSDGSPMEVAAKLNALQRVSKLPLLVAADLETGAGFRFHGAVQMPGEIPLGGATEFPYLMAVGATGDSRLAYEMGAITAEEGRAVGVQVAFAPVLDVNDNPNNPIINVRSFGGDPNEVGRLGCAFMKGIQDHGEMATGKHFPGHGDTNVDSHLAMPVVRYDRAHLDSIELKPFQMAIDSGIDAIMSAHIDVPALNGHTDLPATLSHDVLTDLLRNQMGFHGLVFTDAMDMGALTRRYPQGEAAVRAVLAGADVLIQPLSVGTDLDAIVAAVKSGRIPEAVIDHAVLRILRAKQKLGLERKRTVDLTAIPSIVGIPAHQRVAAEIARRSITLLRNGRDLLPLDGTRSARVLSVTYRRESDVLAGRYFNDRLRDTYPRLVTADVDEDTPGVVFDGLERRARRSALVVVSTYVTAVSYDGSVALPMRMSRFIERLGAMGVPHIVITFGNPYLLSEFPHVQAYMLAWSGCRASQEAAAAALFGEFTIDGHTPTAVPPFYRIGDGLTIPAREAGAGA